MELRPLIGSSYQTNSFALISNRFVIITFYFKFVDLEPHFAWESREARTAARPGSERINIYLIYLKTQFSVPSKCCVSLLLCYM